MAEVKPITPTNSNIANAASKSLGMGASSPAMPVVAQPAAVAKPAVSTTVNPMLAKKPKPTKNVQKQKQATSPSKPLAKPSTLNTKKATAKTSFAPAESVKSTAAKAAIAGTAKESGRAADKARHASQTAMDFGANNMKKALSDSANKFTQATEKASRSMSEAWEQSRDGLEAAIQSSNITTNMSRALAGEFFRFANETFSDNIEASKEIFNCKTASDVLAMQSKLMRGNIDHFFNQSDRLSDMFYRFMMDTTEPFNKQMARTSAQMSKNFKF